MAAGRISGDSSLLALTVPGQEMGMDFLTAAIDALGVARLSVAKTL